MDSKNIMVLSPYYNNTGDNCTCIYLTNQQEAISNTPVNHIVEKLHQSFRLSYQANNKWSASRLFDKSQLPFLLDEHHIFIKYQARKGAPKRHGCYGYRLILPLV